jgi:hypothetical protein
MTRNRASAKAAGSKAEKDVADYLANALDDDRIDRRFNEKWSEGGNGCWLWTASLRKNGYGQFYFRSRMTEAHRVSYILNVGTIPDGLQLDHLCRVRQCVNPKHLEPVTAMENTRRAMRLSCVNGHPFTPENTYIPADGKRYCRECRRRRVREYRQRQETK